MSTKTCSLPNSKYAKFLLLSSWAGDMSNTSPWTPSGPFNSPSKCAQTALSSSESSPGQASRDQNSVLFPHQTSCTMPEPSSPMATVPSWNMLLLDSLTLCTTWQTRLPAYRTYFPLRACAWIVTWTQRVGGGTAGPWTLLNGQLMKRGFPWPRLVVHHRL